MRKVDFPASFDPATRVVDCSNIVGFRPNAVVAILDISAEGRPTLYDMQTPGLGYASVSGAALTLACDTSALSSSDTLVVFWDDGQSYGDLLAAIADLMTPATAAANLAMLSAGSLAPLATALLAALGMRAPQHGATGARPSGLNNTTDVGYAYFDTTLGLPVYWTGSTWHNGAGASV